MQNSSVSKSLLSIFLSTDPNYFLRAECETGSSYFTVGSLEVRVSNHFKKDLGNDLQSDVDLVKPLGARTYIASVRGSVFYANMPLKSLKVFLRAEESRKRLFGSKCAPSSSELLSRVPSMFSEDVKAAAEKFLESHPERKPAFSKFAGSGSMSKFREQHPEAFGQAVKLGYEIFGKKYVKGDARKFYGLKESYAQLLDRIKDVPETVK